MGNLPRVIQLKKVSLRLPVMVSWVQILREWWSFVSFSPPPRNNVEETDLCRSCTGHCSCFESVNVGARMCLKENWSSTVESVRASPVSVLTFFLPLLLPWRGWDRCPSKGSVSIGQLFSSLRPVICLWQLLQKRKTSYLFMHVYMHMYVEFIRLSCSLMSERLKI